MAALSTTMSTRPKALTVDRIGRLPANSGQFRSGIEGSKAAIQLLFRGACSAQRPLPDDGAMLALLPKGVANYIR